jgi:hypothetical protein
MIVGPANSELFGKAAHRFLPNHLVQFFARYAPRVQSGWRLHGLSCPLSVHTHHLF